MCVTVRQDPVHCPIKDPTNLDDSCGTVDSDIDSLDGVQASSPSVRMCDADGDVTHPLIEQQEPYFHNIIIKDSIEVQKDQKVNDDELHEENPHLEDYLIPHHRVHIEAPEESEVVEDLSATNKSCSEEASEEATSPEEEASTKDECCSPEAESPEESDVAEDLSATNKCFSEEASEEATSLEEEASTKDECCSPKAESAEESNVAEDLSATDKFCSEDSSEEATSPEEEASTKDECCSPEAEAASEITASQPQEQAKKPKRCVHFGTVLVRDYDLILGDHPCCSYGPPVTISWDYLEYEPVDVNLYEFHHPPRRNLREMGLNYYHRMKILTVAGHTEEELKQSMKELKRAQWNRSITKGIVVRYPLFKAEDVVESAGRKFTRLIKTGSFKRIST